MRRRLLVPLWLVIVPLALVSALLPPAASAVTRSSGDVTIRGVPGTAQRHIVIRFRDIPITAGDEKRVVVPNMPLPAPRRVAAGVVLATAGPTTGVTNTASSPSPAASFAALGDPNTVIPPDTDGAVGSTQLVTMLNSQVLIQDKDGTQAVSPVTLNSFFGPIDGGWGAFDPRIVYDRLNGRWIAAAGDDAYSSSSAILLGVSQTSDATGLWDLYRIAIGSSTIWADYPTLGVDKNWVVVSVNMFKVSGAFDSARVYAVDKAKLYQASAAESHTMFSVTDYSDTLVPAVDLDNTSSTMYLLDDGWFVNGQGYYRISTITGAVGSETLTLGSLHPSGMMWIYNNAYLSDFAPQLGSTQKIQTDDARMQNVELQDGELWFTHTVFLPYDGATRTAVQWGEMTTAGSVTQIGRVDDPTGTYFYAFPSIAVNEEDDVLLGYSAFSSGQYATADYSFRLGTDPPSTLEGGAVLKAGEASYYKTFGSGHNRWGDYSMASVDPTDTMSMWTIQEYAATPAAGACSPNCDRWGTWWGEVIPGRGTLGFSSTAYSFSESAGAANVTVNRTAGSSGTVGVHYATSDGTATAGSDYVATSGNLSFGEAVTSQTFPITILNDSTHESNETVILTLSSPTGGASLGTSSAVLTIVDDDPIYKPDAKIKLGSDASYIGNNIYNLTGANQTRTVNASRGSTKTFNIAVQDDGTVTDSYKLKGGGSTTAFTVKYLAGLSGTTDITSAIVAGTYTLSSIGVGATKYIRMVITVKSSAAIGVYFGRLVTATSTHASIGDAVKGLLKTIT